ncbi:amino acid adenylation domain-containing protein [Paractinoplanes hotanensis]|uniref:Amino acid adenylation domain-containing protein n=1 Tax=Paractinoplanes hotanensis TaxID=2906497 RepID=A0ABT0YAP5_9ACTN|nr:amino acid adenylation domain-containing protein [Actinoplanes hotanensis]MCM4083111.1 amino acid adenylation domain-containing protein [Actinoplanes hotanensis]
MPRFSEDHAGLVRQRFEVPAELAAAVRSTAAALGLEPHRLLDVAWLRTRSTLTGQPDLPPGAWRSLLADAETLADGELLVGEQGDGFQVTVTAGIDLLRSVDATRVGEYLLGVASAITADPDAPHEQHSLLTGKDVWRQLNVLRGEIQELPALLPHQIFEQHARRTPEAVAAVLGADRWTYAELDAYANGVAARLRAAGLRAGDVAGVVSDRTLPWVAGIVGVLKAGGVYLPIDPAYPDRRITEMLERSGARHLLTDGRAVPADCPAAVLELAAPPAPAGAPVDIAADAPAYIYFTSGSTGSPKGALCRHDGMLNHLLAKVDDLELTAADAVCQNAPQCFDISLWQVLAPLMVGGRTTLLPPAVILDIEGFLETIARERVTVLQLVPSYLEVLLAYLDDHPGRGLAPLRMVCVTGEAIAPALVRRWFARFDIPMVNAYGATECSDDTTHEVMRTAPDRDPVPVGRPVQNVDAYILDPNGGLVPFGAPGEIVFSGICVGAGYVNDPERTAEVFRPDPFRPGQRMYRTGDYGRWLSNGHLEFLGRRDEQVKISGMRVEIGEVENHLRRVPGVRSACVLAVPIGSSKRLAAFFASAEPIPELRKTLAGTLPAHMVPATLHRIDELPLTENGKVDKRALTSIAVNAIEAGPAMVLLSEPTTATQRRLANAWAEVLGIPLEHIRLGDNFFDLGGNSLAAVRLVVKLNPLITLTDLTTHPVLRDLAAAVSGTSAGGPPLRLLQALSDPDSPGATVVGMPDAAGSALNFQPLADGLRRRRIALFALEPPGHDMARPDEQCAGVEEIAARVADEIRTAVPGPLIVWGHGAGAAVAIETARLLARAGAPPTRVFVAAATADPAALDRMLAETETLSAADIRHRLAVRSAYTELDEWQEERAALVERTYRHDMLSAGRYLREARHRLPLPLDVVLGEHDAGPYAGWERIASAARTTKLPDAGPAPFRSRPEAVVELLLDAIPSAAA